MRKWVEVTSLNGVSDLFNARNNKFGFTTWFIIMISMTGLCSYSMFRTIQGFINSPTVTTITTVSNATMEMPDILLCYTGGYNVNKIKDSMVMSQNFIKNFAYGFSDELLEVTKNEELKFYEYLKEHNMNWEQFLLNISYECDEIIEYRRDAGRMLNYANRCHNVSQKYVEYYKGSCLLLQDNGDQKWPGIIGGLDLELKEPNGSHQQMYPGLVPSGFDLDISRRYNGPTLQTIKLPAKVVATINVKATLHKRLRNCDSNLYEDKPSANSCYRSCLKKTLQNICNCIFSIDKTSENETLCSIYDYRYCLNVKVEAMYKILKQCTPYCLPNCIEWEYNFATTLSNSISNDRGLLTKITVAFNTFQYTKDEEHQSLTFDMVVGNVGGIAGLYLGCSMITVFQLIYHLILQCIDSTKKTFAKYYEKKYCSCF